MRLTKTYADGTYGVADDLPCGENSYDFKKLLIDKLGACETFWHEKAIIQLQEELETALAELTKEREANTKKDAVPEWYADKQNWKSRKRCGNCGHHLENDLDHDSAEWDEGARARLILEGNEPNEGNNNPSTMGDTDSAR